MASSSVLLMSKTPSLPQGTLGSVGNMDMTKVITTQKGSSGCVGAQPWKAIESTQGVEQTS